MVVWYVGIVTHTDCEWYNFCILPAGQSTTNPFPFGNRPEALVKKEKRYCSEANSSSYVNDGYSGSLSSFFLLLSPFGAPSL